MRRTTSRAAAVLLAVALLSMAAAGTATAAPTCSEEMGIDVHGQHIVSDYVVGDHVTWPRDGGNVGSAIAGGGAALAGAPGPKGHGLIGAAFGASFCVDQSQSPGWHF